MRAGWLSSTKHGVVANDQVFATIRIPVTYAHARTDAENVQVYACCLNTSLSCNTQRTSLTVVVFLRYRDTRGIRGLGGRQCELGCAIGSVSIFSGRQGDYLGNVPVCAVERQRPAGAHAQVLVAGGTGCGYRNRAEWLGRQRHVESGRTAFRHGQCLGGCKNIERDLQPLQIVLSELQNV